MCSARNTASNAPTTSSIGNLVYGSGVSLPAVSISVHSRRNSRKISGRNRSIRSISIEWNDRLPLKGLRSVAPPK
ncbi:Uncharacterised protein [Mycobacteroides abscessus subsp. abscessus]|nr:Uncharacterised protein [Mycobacteroides abscessus subsp. abscessus]SIJ61651.1 Uncharacterised protein [Mycobacteroides abscessus subsp. abscessus]